MTVNRTSRRASWPGTVLPFPLKCRVAFVERQAHQIAGMSANAGERHLAHQLRVQREALERRGIDRMRINSEITSLEAAIKAALWKAVLAPGGQR